MKRTTNVRIITIKGRLCYNDKMKKKPLIFLIVLVLIGLDLFSKQVITSNIALGQRVTVIDNFFWLTNVENSGAAWSILENHTWILTAVSWGVGAYLGYYMIKNNPKGLQLVALVMIFAGTIGNGVDRLFFGYVRDFLSFNIFGYMFPVFNVADSLLTVGVILILFDMLVFGSEKYE